LTVFKRSQREMLRENYSSARATDDEERAITRMKLSLQQLEAHLWGAANILRGKTAGQDYKNYILSLMFYKRLCDQWECEADDAIAELERQQGRAFSENEKAVFRKRGKHRFKIPDGSR
jgi:type I restriction enzyme M protein